MAHGWAYFESVELTTDQLATAIKEASDITNEANALRVAEGMPEMTSRKVVLSFHLVADYLRFFEEHYPFVFTELTLRQVMLVMFGQMYSVPDLYKRVSGRAVNTILDKLNESDERCNSHE